MILTWQKKGFFSGTLFLKNGEQTVWTFASKDSLQQTIGDGTVSASLTCVAKDFSRNGLTLIIPFHVLDTQKNDILVEATFQWNLREIMSLSAGASHAVGTIRCASGETFQVSVLKQANSHEMSILSASPAARLIAHGKKTVETDMNPDDRVASMKKDTLRQNIFLRSGVGCEACS